MFVRVKDKSTGHEFDVPESDPRIGEAFSLVSKSHYPPSRAIRPPKHNIGRKPRPNNTKPSDVAEDSKEETNHG